jgi:hypothetical protein
MDYRCPCCGQDLGTRKRRHALIARMEIDCEHCKQRIRLNMHPMESRIVFASFGSFLALGIAAWALKSEPLTVLALFAGAAAPLVLPFLERTWWRDWARYVPANDRDGP